MENTEQHQTYEKARKRTKQRKSLYFHFLLFLVGSIFLIVLNQVFHFGKEQLGDDWFVIAVLLWFFLWIMHFVNVIFMKRFFDDDWERRETDKLVAKHNKKVAKLEKKLINQGVISPDTEKKTLNN